MTKLEDLQQALLNRPGKPKGNLKYDLLAWMKLEDEWFNSVFDSLSTFQAGQVAKEQALRTLLKNRPPTEGYSQFSKVNHALVIAEFDKWVNKFEKVFDEVFGKTEDNK